MPFMAWNDRLIVGVGAIDGDHRELLSIMNMLYDGVNAGWERDVMESILKDLVNYTGYHFSREEELMKRYECPGALAHTMVHEQMTIWCRETQEKFHRGILPAPALQTVNYLKDWLFDHIMKEDRRLGRFLMEKGVAEVEVL